MGKDIKKIYYKNDNDNQLMKALYYSDWDVIEITEVPVPLPREGEVQVRVEACGFCGSELETFKTRSTRRTPPLILGHEFAGRIESAGPGVTDFKKGQKVMVNSVISCGNCPPCKRGQTHLCVNRQVFGMNRPGAMAEFVIAPAEYVYPLPDDFPPVDGALIEPLANAVHVVDLLPGKKEPLVVLFGMGPIGLMILQACKVLLKGKIIAIDTKESRLKIAEELGADQLLNPNVNEPGKEISQFTGGEGADISIDAVGTSSTKISSIDVLRPGGTALWIGLYDNELQLDSYEVVLKEKKILGSYSATKDDFIKAAELLYTKQVRGDNWVTLFSMNDAVSAFYRMLNSEGDDCKAVILPQKWEET